MVARQVDKKSLFTAIRKVKCQWRVAILLAFTSLN